MQRLRLNLYLPDEEFRRQIRVAAAKRDTTITGYCVQAIEEKLVTDGERPKAVFSMGRPRRR